MTLFSEGVKQNRREKAGEKNFFTPAGSGIFASLLHTADFDPAGLSKNARFLSFFNQKMPFVKNSELSINIVVLLLEKMFYMVGEFVKDESVFASLSEAIASLLSDKLEVEMAKIGFSAATDGLTVGNAPSLRMRKLFALMKCWVNDGSHPHFVDGWWMAFEFPNGIHANVVYFPGSQGIEVNITQDGAMAPVEEWLDVSGSEAVDILISIMERDAS